MDISVVVPLLNEAESLPELEAWIRRVMDETVSLTKLSLSMMAPPIIPGPSSSNFRKPILM